MLDHYTEMLGQIKKRIKQGQTRAVFSANAEMITMYWDIGHILHDQQQRKGWGARIIPQLARDIRNELPEVKGFSERNIKLMVQFYHEYPSFLSIGQRAVAQLTDKSPVVQKRDDAELMQQLVAQLPWAHNVILIQKIKDVPTRCWNMFPAQAGMNRGKKSNESVLYLTELIPPCIVIIITHSSKSFNLVQRGWEG